MARLAFIAMLFTFMFIQLASSQDVPSQACTDATLALGTATQCQGDDTSVVCVGECRSLAEAFFSACANVAGTQEARDAYNAVCGGAGVLKGLGGFSLLLISFAAAVIF